MICTDWDTHRTYTWKRFQFFAAGTNPLWLAHHNNKNLFYFQFWNWFDADLKSVFRFLWCFRHSFHVPLKPSVVKFHRCVFCIAQQLTIVLCVCYSITRFNIIWIYSAIVQTANIKKTLTVLVSSSFSIAFEFVYIVYVLFSLTFSLHFAFWCDTYWILFNRLWHA